MLAFGGGRGAKPNRVNLREIGRSICGMTRKVRPGKKLVKKKPNKWRQEKRVRQSKKSGPRLMEGSVGT